MKFRAWLHILFLFRNKLAEMTVLWCDVLCVILSRPVSSDLPCDGVALGALHAAPLPAPAHRLELLPALCGEGQLQPGPGE